MKSFLTTQKKTFWSLSSLMLIFSMSMVAYDASLLKLVMFVGVLMRASYLDVKTRIIPDWIHLLIIGIALIDIKILDSVLGLLVIPLPFFIMAYKREGSIGGGDIKLIGACSFMLGLSSAYLGVLISLVLVVIHQGMIKGKHASFAFVPYIGVGMLIASSL